MPGSIWNGRTIERKRKGGTIEQAGIRGRTNMSKEELVQALADEG